MRTLSVAVASSLVALIGFTSTAHANATIELLWGGESTHATITTSATVSLYVVYTNDQLNVGASVSVDYSDANGKYSVVGIANNPNSALGILPLSLGAPTDDGSAVRNIQAQALPPYVGTGLPAGQSYLLGTITFHKDGPGDGAFTLQAFLGPGDTIAGGGTTICNEAMQAACTMGSATLNNLPEPNAVLILALGVAGLLSSSRVKPIS